MTKRIAFLTASEGIEAVELTDPWDAVTGAGHTAELLSPEAGEELLEELFTVLYDPDHAFEHEWREHDLVVWDNLAVQHARGRLTQEGPERSLRKVSAPPPSAALNVSKEKPSFARGS